MEEAKGKFEEHPYHFSPEEMKKMSNQINQEVMEEKGAKKERPSHFSDEEIDKLIMHSREQNKTTKGKIEVVNAEDFIKMADDFNKKFDETHETVYLELAQTCRRRAKEMEKEQK